MIVDLRSPSSKSVDVAGDSVGPLSIVPPDGEAKFNAGSAVIVENLATTYPNTDVAFSRCVVEWVSMPLADAADGSGVPSLNANVVVGVDKASLNSSRVGYAHPQPSFVDVVKSKRIREGYVHPCAISALVVFLGKEVDENIAYYSNNALICIFFCLWPSLPDLHLWITNHWSPLVDGPMEIYPSTRGFLVVGFSSPDDRQDFFYYGLWVWDSHPLSIRPWVYYFNHLNEPLDVLPIWVRLSYLPL